MVVGSGFMGAGIAQVALQAGFDVVLNDTALELVERGVAAIKGNFDRLVSKGKLDEDRKKDLLGRVTASAGLEDAAGVDLAIEAAFENFDVKKGIFEKLDAVCRPDVVFATKRGGTITRREKKNREPMRIFRIGEER